MKKDYVKPSAYFELFQPNQYAGNCQGGISEKDMEPKKIDCMWGEYSSYWRQEYSFNPNSCSSTIDRKSGGCTNYKAEKTLLTNLCDINFSDESSYGSGSGVTMAYDVVYKAVKQSGKYVKGDEVKEGAVYIWSNGSSGTHSAWATSVIPGQTYDGQGRPYYFNS